MYSVREVIQAARRQRGWGQRQLAEASGVSQPNLAAIETGTRAPSLAMVSRLVGACGLQLRFDLEPRHADVDAEIRRLRERPAAGRLAGEGFGALITLTRLANAGAPLVLDGPIAARLHGAPVAAGVERVWCHHDDVDQLREAVAQCHRDLRPVRPRYDEEYRLVYGEGDQVRIGDCRVTLGSPPSAVHRVQVLRASLSTVGIDQLPLYPHWTPRDRVIVRRLVVLLSDEVEVAADVDTTA
jgi:transcriptional regulator with XRE-family HTH domain